MKGGIISSAAEAEKNKLSTGTLTFEDLENKADYKASSVGVNANINNKAEYNEKGVTPNIGVPASGEAESKTKASISEGTIEIRDKENQKQDINKLNRDTNNSLNKLGEIFDKTKIEERQELANLFGELAYNEIHRLADKNGWQEGSAEKNALHALVGGIMSELTGNGFLAGASASAINEMVQQKLAEQFKDEPDKHQWASAIIGGVVSQLVAGKAQAGASTAANGTKNNDLDQELSTARGHLPKTESQVMDGAEQNTSDKYELTPEELLEKFIGDVKTSAGDESLKKLLSKEYPDYIRIESYPGSNNAFRIYYKSGGKMVSSVLRKVPLASGGDLLIKVSNDYIDKKDLDWEKEIGKFIIDTSIGEYSGKVIGGVSGIAVGVIAGGIIDTSLEKMWERISAFNNGGVPLD